ncbi:hypothetical protein GO755_30520 [Spirosoma sp. HMF4905]|uniref:Uncharacterized protein n=1 Tax=Spirosoma arboris TaxID=2682092 RepID=A0A7K1SLF5_9BACT|nr:hypothetical protein [Spirosoma arboris]MVM34406.1 hypothetical protein [Spirosoma arboris]
MMTPLYNKPTREVLHEGLIDLDCSVREFTLQPGKKAVKVLHRRINPDRAASRALMCCGTNPRK